MSDAVDRLVQVMDQLRSPGGCPWDAEQTHESLARYALEEAYELVEAIEDGSRQDIREELGDVLLQVVFHARVAEDHADDPFSVDDIAAAVTAKLIERHPHVFGDADAADAADVRRRWDQIKAETQTRESVLDGIPLGQSALARAQQVLSRSVRAGLQVRDEASADIGAQLLALVARAEAEGVDAEGALRGATRAYEQAARSAERIGDGAPATEQAR